MIRFGTDGIRGTAGQTPCTVDVALRIGRAAARLAGEGGRVLVARDTRPSGPALSAAVISGIASAGVTAMRAGVLPTSGLACALRAELADVGVMVTASHNPWPDNGFKVLGRGGRKLDDSTNALFERWIAEPWMETRPGEVLDAQDMARTTYLAGLSDVLAARKVLQGRRVAIDLSNGAMTVVRDWIEAAIPVDWVFVDTGNGRINEGCGSEHPGALAAAVREHQCDAGIAVDGDGDRCVLVDDTGEIVPGDALAWVLARGMGVSSMSVTVMSNGALEAGLPGVKVVRTPVGDRHLGFAMASQGIPLGCEESGHVLFSDALPCGDGLVTGVRALVVGLNQGKLSRQLARFTLFPRRVTKVVVRHRPELDGVPELLAAVQDGERTLGVGGRVFLRYSGTEPVLRILVEGEQANQVEEVSVHTTRVAAEVLA